MEDFDLSQGSVRNVEVQPPPMRRGFQYIDLILSLASARLMLCTPLQVRVTPFAVGRNARCGEGVKRRLDRDEFIGRRITCVGITRLLVSIADLDDLPIATGITHPLYRHE